MSNVLIVGASSGYGRALAASLQDRAEVIGLSRQPERDHISHRAYPLTDVSNTALFTREFTNALHAEPEIDAVAFIPGDVLPKEARDYTPADLQYMVDVNVGYVARGLELLQDHPRVKTIVTIGSQWSYREQFDRLAAYALTKHALKHLSARFAETGKRSLHLCVPTTRTEKLEKIAPFLTGRHPSLPAPMDAWADPNDLAPHLGTALLDPTMPSGAYVFHKGFTEAWSLEALSEGHDRLDQMFRSWPLERFFDPTESDQLYRKFYEYYISRELEEPSEGRERFR